MKVAVFPRGEEMLYGACPETSHEFDWHAQYYRVVELSESEVAELHSAFRAFSEAQKKIRKLIYGIEDEHNDERIELHGRIGSRDDRVE